MDINCFLLAHIVELLYIILFSCLPRQISGQEHPLPPAVFRDGGQAEASGVHHPLLGQAEAACW